MKGQNFELLNSLMKFAYYRGRVSSKTSSVIFINNFSWYIESKRQIDKMKSGDFLMEKNLFIITNIN